MLILIQCIEKNQRQIQFIFLENLGRQGERFFGSSRRIGLGCKIAQRTGAPLHPSFPPARLSSRLAAP